MNTHKYMLTL